MASFDPKATVSNPGVSVKALWATYRESGYDPSIGQKLGVHENFADRAQSFDRLSQTKELQYTYDLEHGLVEVLNKSGRKIAYLKPGVKRAQDESALYHLAHSMGLGLNFAPCCINYIDSSRVTHSIEFGKRCPIDLTELDTGDHGKYTDHLLFSEPTFGGKNFIVLPEKGKSFKFKGPIVATLSFHIDETEKEDAQRQVTLRTAIFAAIALGVGDLQKDNIVADKLVDYEEALPVDVPGRASLHLPVLATPAGKSPFSTKEKEHLCSLVKKWDPKEIERTARTFKIKWRYPESVEKERSTKKVCTVDGLNFLVEKSGRDSGLFPYRGPKDEQLFADGQIDSLVERVTKLKSVLLKPAEEDAEYPMSLWTLAFEVSPYFRDACSLALEAREAFITSPTQHLEGNGIERALHLDGEYSSFVACVLERTGAGRDDVTGRIKGVIERNSPPSSGEEPEPGKLEKKSSFAAAHEMLVGNGSDPKASTEDTSGKDAGAKPHESDPFEPIADGAGE